jgi:hypothetical protein
MKTVVIYHRADFDGLFCREIARKFLPDAELIGWDYGDPVPTPDVVSSDDTLYMLDISVEGLMGHPNLIWIDHHKSAMEKFGKLAGYQIDGVAACRLAWQWFGKSVGHAYKIGHGECIPTKQEFIDRTVSEPLAVRLAGEYDIWDKRDPRADTFQHGLISRELFPDSWLLLLSEGPSSDTFLGDLLVAGRGIEYAKTKENEIIAKRTAFTATFEGLDFCAFNNAYSNSKTFEAAIKPHHQGLMSFYWSGTDWRVSLYHAPGKEHHDLSAIAVKYGGGGHKGACGFRTDHLPFLT